MTGEKQSVIQDASPRELDGRMFKYVRVAGIDKRRIVQVGISAEVFRSPTNTLALNI